MKKASDKIQSEIKLSSTLTKKLTNVKKQMLAGAINNKDLFKMFYDEIKLHKDIKDTKRVKLLVTASIENNQKDNSITKSIMGIYSLTEKYVELKIVMKFDNIQYYNIKNIVSLLKKIKTEKTRNNVIEQFYNLYDKKYSEYKYNNDIEELYIKLNNKYTIVKSFELTDTIKDKLLAMKIETIETLITELQNKVNDTKKVNATKKVLKSTYKKSNGEPSTTPKSSTPKSPKSPKSTKKVA